MLQRYKLRLGDGTVLLVDHDGLAPWLVDKTATVQTEGSSQWSPLREFLARERAAARRASRRRVPVHESMPALRPGAPRDDSPAGPPRADGLPLIPPPRKREASPPASVPAPREDGLPLVPPPPRGEAAVGDEADLHDDEEEIVVPTEASGTQDRPVLPAGAADEELAPVVLSSLPSNDESEHLFEPSSLVEPDPASETPVPTHEDEALAPTVIVGAPRRLLVDEVAGTDEGPGGEPILAGVATPEVVAIRDLPVIPLKPLPEPEPVGAWAPRRPEPESEPHAPLMVEDPDGPSARRHRDAVVSPRVSPEVPGWATHPRVASALLLVGAIGSVLSRGLEPLNRLERGEPPLVVEEGALTRARQGMRRLIADAIGRLRTLRIRFSRRPRATEDPVATPTTAVASAPSTSVPSLPAPAVPTPTAPPAVVTPPAVRSVRARPLRPAAPLPRHDPEPPPAVERLEVVPLADMREEPGVRDVYGGVASGSVLPRLWIWAKRVVAMSAVVAASVLAAVSWEIWFPRAGRVGQAAFGEIDRHARAGERERRQQRVLADAAARLPYLAPQTVRLILSRSPTGVLEVPDIFEAACDAADWGSWVLSPEEAEELRELRGQLIAGLGPVDRGRALEYDHARASGLVFPLDNRLGALTWARGARALSPQGQERLRELLGKAIAAGLASSEEVASGAAREP